MPDLCSYEQSSIVSLLHHSCFMVLILRSYRKHNGKLSPSTGKLLLCQHGLRSVTVKWNEAFICFILGYSWIVWPFIVLFIGSLTSGQLHWVTALGRSQSAAWEKPQSSSSQNQKQQRFFPGTHQACVTFAKCTGDKTKHKWANQRP